MTHAHSRPTSSNLWFRMDVPKDIRDLAGVTSWQKSLGTADPRLADARRASYSAHYKTEVLRLRGIKRQQVVQDAERLVGQAFDRLARYFSSMDVAIYLAGRPAPSTPRDLADHRCVNLRFPTHGGLYAWEFERDGRELSVRVEGQVVVNDIALARRAALDGAGIAYLPEDYVADDLTGHRLTRILADWCPPFPGYHLYYPSRRQLSPAMTILIEALKGSRPLAPVPQSMTT